MKGDQLAQREQEKYQKVYSAGAYTHEESVGFRVAPIAWGWAVPLAARSLTDWGTGHGRAMRWFRTHGLDAWGIDLVPCVNTKDDPQALLGTLWDPPAELPPTDFCFSADVLEHLPEKMVPMALAQIRAMTGIGGWMQVATIPDQKGEELGETLHLTVRPADWWVDMLEGFFHVVGTEETDREVRLWLEC